MRFYDKQKYLIFKPDETERPNANIVTGAELKEYLKDGSIMAGDEIYAVRPIAVAEEKREIILAPPA